MGMQLKGLYREDIPEISTEALREAIINAFCHRDYRDPDHVQIAVFKDRVEIRSPGELFDGMTIARMRRGNISRRRNPLIADLLRRVRMVEAWGRGLTLIIEKEPGVVFKETSKLFVASFARPSFFDSETPFLEKMSEKMSEKTSDLILEMISKNPIITIAELRSKIGVSDRTIERKIRKLQSDGRIRRMGPDKGGHWEVLL